ncbi:MAG: alpha/beta hydrolase [Sediminibacterium sp.]|jgi:pimeloyl-ACP methyl ester carboxylesterase|nr:MAG: alpha/beta hydrolase [Sediminibacterium sp.]
MEYEIIKDGNFEYLEVGEGETLMLCHGLFGALSNFADLIEKFRFTHKVVVPILPLFDLDILHTTVSGLEKHVAAFIEYKNYTHIHLLGNSLGGHVALVYILKHPERVKSLILTGSSGLFENAMGDSYPRRGDYEYIKNKTAQTFYDPAVATPALVDEVFEITKNRLKVIKILSLAKSAIRHNLAEDLHQIQQPTLLIWGKNDIVTPPFVAEEFKKLIPNSQLDFIDKCGHAPMMEVPAEFNIILEKFLGSLPK